MLGVSSSILTHGQSLASLKYAFESSALKPYTLSSSLDLVLDSLRRHPRRVMAALATVLLGTGVTAFGVAPLAPDAADLPVVQVVEQVQPLPVRSQADALLDHRFSLYRTEVTLSLIHI